MGLAAAPARARDAREDFLRKLDGSIDEIAAQVERLVGAEEMAVVQRPLAAQLKTLAAEAVTHGPAELAEELHAARAIVEGAGILGVLGETERLQLDETIVRVAGFARAELERAAPGSAALLQPRRRTRAGAVRIVLSGPRPMAESLLAEDWIAEDDAPALQVERAEDHATAHRIARTRKPDALVVDADADGAKKLVERLVADRATEDL